MKTLRLALLVLGAGTAGLMAAPRLFVSTPTLIPESGIELILDRPVVPDDAVGKPAANDWLVVEPALPGKLEWKAPNVARFLPDQAPTLGTSYKFSVRGGHKHLDQTPVPAGVISTVESTPFQIESKTALDRNADGYSPRKASYLLTFNDDVDPAVAAPFFLFENKAGVRIAARTERATAGQAGVTSLDTYSWTQRFARAKAKTPVDPNATRPGNDPFVQGLVVTPLTILPVGQGWKLSVLPGLPNAAANARLRDNSSQALGDIDPLRVSEINAVTTVDKPREILVGFNLALPKTISAELLKASIHIAPELENMTATVDEEGLHIHGDFKDVDGWEITVTPPLASYDGRVLSPAKNKKLLFKHLDPELTLPSTEEAQLAAGSRRYSIETVNVQKVDVRARQLSGENLIRAFQGYRHYTGQGPDGAEVKPTAPVPFELISGPTVLNKSFELGKGVDTSGKVTLEWDKVLPGAPKHGTYFLEATGTLTEGITNDDGRPSAQAFIQLTDIGLAWKLTTDEAMIYAFSCSTGEALPGVKLEVFGEEAKLLHSATTDANGLAKLPREKDNRHLRATLGDDCYVSTFDGSIARVSLWRFPVHYSYDEPPVSQRRVMGFTDRSLYRPGETMRLKGIVRNQHGNLIEAADAAKPHLIIADPTDKEVLNKEITLSANGSFDLEYKTPDEQTGTYTARLVYKKEVPAGAAPKAADKDEDEDADASGSSSFEFPFRVEEFRRNAFEVQQEIAEPAPGAESVKIALAATYYQGQPVAAGKAEHNTRIADTNLYPDRFRDFLFGNHHEEDWHYWFHYFNYKESEDNEDRSTAENGSGDLDANGKALFAVTLPKGDIPTTREVTVSTEVTDANNQTLTASSTTTVHPSSIYIGVSRTDRLVRVGDKVPLKLVAVTPAGEPFDQPVTLETVITREVNEQSKTRTDGGATVTRNDSHEEEVSKGITTIPAAGNKGEGSPYTFTAAEPGRHFLTFKGKDNAGRPFATTTTYWVYGSTEYPWAYEDGMKIKLVAEKKSYRPGDVARVLVLSPIEGTALVTVERESVLRSFTIALKADKPVIEIPLNEGDAPNAFVSVLVVKGSKDSARDFKQPQLRLGYCELTVEDLRDKLAVKVAAENSTESIPVSMDGAVTQVSTYRPGDEVILAGTVTRADGSPAAGAEVTLYAEDEGTLAVMGYENPDPMAFFYDPRELGVGCGTSLDNFISENPDDQQFFNKGFFVGGGDDMNGDLAKLLRKNFDPCATWAPSLVTDAQGHFRHSFKVPDTLTRYRVLAVASDQASRFGMLKTDIVVNKSLMLEPKAPRFANESDLITPQVLVQNASGHRGTWKITFNPNATSGTPVCRALAETTQSVTVEANGSAVVPFQIAVETTGEAVLTFRAEPVSIDGVNLTPVLMKKYSDAVETRFPVNYPMPLIRQTKLVKLAGGGAETDLRSQLDPTLLEGKGDVKLEFSRSLLMEAGPSIDYLLDYPHGCVEQTTSSMMPWFAVKALRPVVPRLEKVSDAKVAKAIQAGVERLLTMQLPTGGFAYWPGGRERVDWASSYAGLGLVLADQAGAVVPEAAIESMCNDLIGSLRGLSDVHSAWDMESATRSLWVLAMAGKPQEAYQNLLRDHLENVPPRARRFLALAIAESENESAKAEAIAVLNSTKPYKAKDDSWMPWNADSSMDVLAWSTISPGSPESTRALDRLFRDRNPYGEWHTTWMNGWSLLGIASYAEAEQPQRDRNVAVTVTTAKGAEPFTLASATPVASRSFVTGANVKALVKSDGPAFVRVSVAAKPKIMPQQPVASNGLEITRFYEHLKADGSSEPLSRPAVGDLVKVTLRVTLPKDDNRYLVIEDPLPSIFETVNSDFASQAAANGGHTSEHDWSISHTELRSDRAVFFFDRVWHRGTYNVTYLVRCTVAGETIAPAAKVESMYDPERFALSATQVFRTK